MASIEEGDSITMDPVENSIVQDFQNLKVLNAFNYDQMDDLVRDLTNALDDSMRHPGGHKRDEPSCSSRKQHSSQKKVKRKSKKRKSGSKDDVHSDATESSIDEALKGFLENVTQQSDSDEWILNTKNMQPYKALSKQSLPQVESDSFTENFSPLQQNRHRRRKFKRMSVDLTSSNPQYDDKVKSIDMKIKMGKNHKCDSSSRLLAPPIEDETIPGKRKRGLRGCGNSFEIDLVNEDSNASFSEDTQVMDLEYKESNSSLSSSDCNDALVTGDEGQEGDDEQSDFFHEPGPVYGIPGISPWWENEGETSEIDQVLQTKESSYCAQRIFRTRLKQLVNPGRQYRSARRFFKDRHPDYSLSKFLQDRQRWFESCNSKKSNNGCSTSGNGQNTSWYNHGVVSGADIKRRRKTPPATPTPEDYSIENEPNSSLSTNIQPDDDIEEDVSILPSDMILKFNKGKTLSSI